MNPYLERPGVWVGFHNKLASELQTLLTQRLPAGYYAELGEEIYLRADDADDASSARPDVWIGAGVTRAQDPPHAQASNVAIAPEQATIDVAPDDELRLWHIDVRDDDGELVTAIEILSPTNKLPGNDRRAYMAKRRKLLRSDANLVEIDLLRNGPRMPLTPDVPSDYRFVVSRADRRPSADVWRFGIRDAMPLLPIPLRATDPEVVISLREALDRAYDGAGYAPRLYRSDPEPPLNADDLAWAKSLIA